MDQGRQSRAIALRATNASIEANVTTFELVTQLIADGLGTRRRAAPMTLIRSHGATEGPAKIVVGRRALG